MGLSWCAAELYRAHIATRNGRCGSRRRAAGIHVYIGALKNEMRKEERGAVFWNAIQCDSTYSRAQTHCPSHPRRGPSLKIHSVNNDPSPSQSLLGASIAASSHTASLFLLHSPSLPLSEPHATHTETQSRPRRTHTHTHTPSWS